MLLQTALNLVQLWENSTIVSIHGQNGFSVAVRDRAYQYGGIDFIDMKLTY